MEHFKYSFIVTGIGLFIALLWGGIPAVTIAAILAVLEVSLSFDNAVVNAGVLKDMDNVWKHRFLTWGMLIAVLGMRLVFPVVIVAMAADLGVFKVAYMAVAEPELYSSFLTSAHIQISAFGGTFLLLVFLYFILDHEKEVLWLEKLEQKLFKIGKLDSAEIVIALFAILIMHLFLPEEEKLSALLAGLGGIVLYVLISSIELLEIGTEKEVAGKVLKRSGVMAFVYLEVLDASFSFDGVIGAFAITKDVVVIMVGLAIGAMFVRSLTIFLVEKGTLDEYIFLEHGAHYAIGALATIMLLSMVMHISEVFTGLIGVTFIGLSVYSSMQYRKAEAAEAAKESTEKS
ncbi:MAG: DUF475 domain-containing protein [Methylococcaceae bacterium]|nr:DUF475 domain-containing protein [Methylococcaceae bacterium]